jgi:hypothetical protein
MRLINRLAGIAAASGKVDRGALQRHAAPTIAYTLWDSTRPGDTAPRYLSGTGAELSVGLARYNGMLFRGGLKVMARVTGRMFQAGQAEPSED